MTPTPAEPDSDDFEAHRHRVFGWAYGVVGHREEAMDITQDVGLRWLGRDPARPLQNPRAWLRRLTVNRAIDFLRRRRVRPIGVGDCRLETDRPTGSTKQASTGLEAAQRRELRRAIDRALAELTDAQRRVLVAKIYEERTFAEIAESTNVAVPTAKTHYLRALRKLRRHLDPTWQP